MIKRIRTQHTASWGLLLLATVIIAAVKQGGCSAAILFDPLAVPPLPSTISKRRSLEEQQLERPWVQGSWKLSRLNSSEPQIMKMSRRGVVCTRCCIVPKELRTSSESIPKGGETFQLSYSHRSYKEEPDSVYVWTARPQDEHGMLPGTSHVVWVQQHSNVLFNLATGMDSWRTWNDLDEPVDRVMLLRSPRPEYEWLFKQLRGLQGGSTKDAPKAMPGPVCFERVVVGLVRHAMKPYDWPTKCKRGTKLSVEGQKVIGGFAGYLQGMLPAAEVDRVGRPDGTQQCRAFVQLRGAPTGPNREPRGRNWLNADKAAQVLRGLGFRVDEVDMRETSMHDAGLLLHAADLVVVPHGAGVANVMFCRPGTTLVELHNWGAQKWVYERISRGLGVQYRPLVCQNPMYCPKTDTEGHPIPETPVEDDKCYRGYLRKPVYNVNHLRDINLDLFALQRTALRTALELRAGEKCRIHLPKHLVPRGYFHEANARSSSSSIRRRYSGFLGEL